MSIIHLLNNGEWNKPPVLTAARKILMDGLSGHYPHATLGDMATFTNGTSYDVGLIVPEGTPIIRISNITNPRSDYLKTQEMFDGRFMVEPGDLLVSWSASFKSIIWPGPSGVLNQHIFKVVEKPGSDRGFVRHAIEAAFDDMQQKVVGIGMMHLRRSDFLGQTIPAPDIATQRAVSRFLDWLEAPNGEPEPTLPVVVAEQRRIVARIEALAAKIAEARGLRRLAIEEAQALITAARRRIIGDAIENNWIPLAGYVEEIENGWSPACEQRPAIGDEWGVLKVGAVSFGRFNERENKALPPVLQPRSQYEIHPGDFLMSRANTSDLVGACAIVDETRPRLMLCDKIFRFHFRPDMQIDLQYLDQVLKSPALRDQIVRGASGTSPTMKNISKLDFPHLHGGADQVSPCRVSSARSCRDFSHFTPEHRYTKSRTRSMQGTEEAQEAL